VTSPILEPLRDEITQTRSVIQSAVVLINGLQQRIRDAVAAALETGATAEELAPFTQLEAGLEADRLELAAAVVANTPGDPGPTRSTKRA